MIRAYGYDSPELKTNCPKEKIAAQNAKKALEDKILGKIVNIEILPLKEKYGRLLAVVHYNNENINEWMIRENYGVKYFGGHKDVYV